MLCTSFDSLKDMSGMLGRLVVAATLLIAGWALFANPIDIVLFQQYLDDGSVVDRIDHCGTIYEVLTGNLDESIEGSIATDRCVKAAGTDATFGGLLAVFFIAVGVVLITSSHRRPLVGMDRVRPLPSSSVFRRHQDAHHARAAELAEGQDDD